MASGGAKRRRSGRKTRARRLRRNCDEDGNEKVMQCKRRKREGCGVSTSTIEEEENVVVMMLVVMVLLLVVVIMVLGYQYDGCGGGDVLWR